VPTPKSILTEITSDGDEQNPSALSTHRSPEKVN